MSKFQKILLGILTAWPFAYIFLFMLFILSMIASGPGGGDAISPFFLLIFPVHILTILLIIGLQIFYIVDVFRNERVEKDHKVIWIIVLFIGGLLAMPIYWYLNIWREVAAGNEQFRGLEAGDSFQPARDTTWEKKTAEPTPPEPHSWR